MKNGLQDLWPLRLLKVVGIKIIESFFDYYRLHFSLFLTHIIVMAASSINESGLQDLWPLHLLKVVGIKIIESFLIITVIIFLSS